MSDVVFYVGAHTDDALLFRGEGVFTDLHTPDVKTVQIVLTADDAGRTDGWWEGHEAACIESMAGTLTPVTPGSAQATVNGHSIQRYTGPTWAYYALRLPDGDVTGEGFPSTGGRSLGKLQSGEISSLSAIDESTTYDIRDRPANLAGRAHDVKWFLFHLYGWKTDELIDTPPNEEEWGWWGARSYARTEEGG